MVPAWPPNPTDGAQSANPSHLQSNSGLLRGAQPGSIPPQPQFSSLASSHTQFNNNSLVGNISNANSFPNQSFGNKAPPSVGGLSMPQVQVNAQQRGGLGGGVDIIGNDVGNPLSFTSSGRGMGQQHFRNPQSNQLGGNHLHLKQPEGRQNIQQQFRVPQTRQQQSLLRGEMGNTGTVGAANLEMQVPRNDQNGSIRHLQSLSTIGAAKMESQSLRSLSPIQLDTQHSEVPLLLQQQQQQQQKQVLQLPRPNSQSAAAQLAFLQQQQQQQQQQPQQQHHQKLVIKCLPQQRDQLQQQFHQQNLAVRPPTKPTIYEPGTCGRRLNQYMYQQQHRPEDNNIEFWRKFVAEYFAPDAKKRWCVSLYGSGHQITGVFPKDVWHCEMCNHKPGRGFEATVEVLPRLFQIKYASGTLERLLYIDMPREHQTASGQIVLDYSKAIQESVYEQLRVVHEGKLRIVFNPDLKISSWEFCARCHEELIPRETFVPQVGQLGVVVQKYLAAAQNSSSSLSTLDLQKSCNSFVACTHHLAKTLEVPLINDLGYTKQFVRCLQISEVVNFMKDLMDYNRETGTGPMDSLINVARRTSSSLGLHAKRPRQPDEEQNVSSTSNHNNHGGNGANVQLAVPSNGNVGPPLYNASSSFTSATPNIGLLPQNSMNARQENQMNAVKRRYIGGSTLQIPSSSLSNSFAQAQPNSSSLFLSPTPASSNHSTPASQYDAHVTSVNSPASLSTLQQPTGQLHETYPSDSPSSVQRILQEILMSSQPNGVSTSVDDMKGTNGTTHSINGGNFSVGNGISSSLATNDMAFSGIGRLGPVTSDGQLGTTISNNSMTMNRRIEMNDLSQDPTATGHQQQDVGRQLLGGLGAVNSFNDLQFDWNSSQ